MTPAYFCVPVGAANAQAILDTIADAFDNFDPVKVAAYDETKIAELLANPGIIRNRLKVEASVLNARAFLAVQKEFGSFDRYLWQFVGGQPIQNRWREIPQSRMRNVVAGRPLLYDARLTSSNGEACPPAPRPRIDEVRGERRVVQPEALHRAGGEVLQQRVGRLQVQGNRRQPLGQRVVNLARQAIALLNDRQLPALLVEAGILDGNGCLMSQRL